MKAPIRIWFPDVYPRCAEFFKWALAKRFELILDEKDPEYIIFSDFGGENRKYEKPIRIYYTGENHRPNFDHCHFALTFDYLKQPNHYRLPLYVLEYHARWMEYHCVDSWDALIRPKPSAQDLLKSKTKFCNFVVSNPNCETRNRFFQLLNEYKRVDSAGSHLNNMNGWTLPKEEQLFFKSKLEFQRDYKFSIAFENSAYPGYLTEKILDPMLANSLPIYWGDPLVHQDFNPKSFINAAAFRSLEELVQWVIKVDQIDDLYFKYAEQPYFLDNRLNSSMDLDALLDFFQTQVFAARQH